MSCERNFEKINLYIDGELDECEKLLMEEHIKTCEKCKKEFELLSSIKRILGEIEKEEVPAGFQVKISEGHLKSIKKKHLFFNLKPAIYFAAAVFLLFSSYSILNYWGIFSSKSGNQDMKEISITMQPSENNGTESSNTSDSKFDQSTSESKISKSPSSISKTNGQRSETTNKPKYTLFSITSRNNNENRTMDTTYEKKIVRSGYISLTTYNIEETMDKVLDLTEGNNGYIETLSSYTDKEGNDIISITFRIPIENFYVVLYNSFSLKGFTGFEENAYDVTDEYYKLINQIKDIESQKSFGIKLPGVSDEKSKTNSELNELTAKKNQLENRIAWSTIKYDIKKVNKR